MNDINYQDNNEIDLIELIKALWNKKILILLSAFFCTAIASVYAFTEKELLLQLLWLHVQLI